MRYLEADVATALLSALNGDTPSKYPTPSHSPKPRGHAHHAPRAYPTSTVHMGRCEGGGSFDIKEPPGSRVDLRGVRTSHLGANLLIQQGTNFVHVTLSLDRSSRFIRY